MTHTAWNFGPESEAALTVAEVADAFCEAWGRNARWAAEQRTEAAPHEAALLSVDASRARADLGWRPRWTGMESISRTAAWYRAFYEGGDATGLVAADIDAFTAPSETDFAGGTN